MVTVIHTKASSVKAGIRDAPGLTRISSILTARLAYIKGQMAKAIRLFQLQIVAVRSFRIQSNGKDKNLLLEVCVMVVADRFCTISLPNKTLGYLAVLLKMKHH